MINLQWGTQKNGQIPTILLVDVSGRGDYMEPSAAHQFLAMRQACFDATGRWINPAPGSSCNRSLATQQAFYDAYRAYLRGGPWAAVAAVPGTSNHGWARAIDITGYEGNTAWRSPRTGTVYMVNIAVWNWLQAHAHDYGYDWATGDGSGEAWHWESLTPPGTASTTATALSTPTAPPILEEGTMLAVFRRANGDIGIFGADFADKDPKTGVITRGRHVVASMSDYNGFKGALDAARAKGGKDIPELPAIVNENSVVTLDDNGWALVCRFFGV